MDFKSQALVQIFDKSVMVEHLLTLCHMNSGTDNLTGQVRMLETLSKLFTPFADSIETIPQTQIPSINMEGESVAVSCGDALFIQKRPHVKRRILLAGHMDTVFSADHPFQNIRIMENSLNGPGVADMKGGLVVMLHALKAFEENPLSNQIGWDVFINADEETGSAASKDFYSQNINRWQAALVYEPALDAEGLFARNRRGSGKLTLVATGKTAHAGRTFHEGRNAICYLAKAITAIHELNGQREGVTINVGRMAGGKALNMVPDKAVAKLDCRISKTEDENWILQAIRHIILNLNHPDYKLDLYGHFNRPVKHISKGTEQLFQQLQKVAAEMGIQAHWQDTGGSCDGNNLSFLGLPVIDTMGVRGGHIHTSDEFILTDSLPERAALSLLLLNRLAAGDLEELKL